MELASLLALERACSNLCASFLLQATNAAKGWERGSLRSVKAGPKCITLDTEVCESNAIIRKRIAIVRGRFASVILAVSPCCLALCHPWL